MLDRDFIAAQTSGFEEFAGWCRQTEWDAIERVSGIPRERIEWTAAAYAKADKAMALYGMGVTQHVGGVEAMQ